MLPDPSGQHPWMSGVTMLVRWLCSFPASAQLPLVGLSTLVLPRPQAMHPSATKGAREPTGCVVSKVGSSSVCPDGLAVTGFGARNAPYYLDKVRVRAVGPSCSQRATSREFRDTVGKTCRTTQKSKDKGKRPIQRRIAKRITLQRRIAKDLQITKLGDDQERRPLNPSGAKRKGVVV